ncbi:hypothetical protein Aduo_007298 [Ancylostoma duodenale]
MYTTKPEGSEATMRLNAVIIVAILLLEKRVDCEGPQGISCAFDGYIVNSTTIKSLLPETGFCEKVTGSIRIDETTNLIHQQLTDALERVTSVSGNVVVVNTLFTNLSFFRDLSTVTGRSNDDGWFHIQHHFQI